MKSKRQLKLRSRDRVTHVIQKALRRYQVNLSRHDVSVVIPTLINSGKARKADFNEVRKEQRKSCSGYFIVNWENSNLIVSLDLINNEIKTILPHTKQSLSAKISEFWDN